MSNLIRALKTVREGVTKFEAASFSGETVEGAYAVRWECTPGVGIEVSVFRENLLVARGGRAFEFDEKLAMDDVRKLADEAAKVAAKDLIPVEGKIFDMTKLESTGQGTRINQRVLKTLRENRRILAEAEDGGDMEEAKQIARDAATVEAFMATVSDRHKSVIGQVGEKYWGREGLSLFYMENHGSSATGDGSAGGAGTPDGATGADTAAPQSAGPVSESTTGTAPDPKTVNANPVVRESKLTEGTPELQARLMAAGLGLTDADFSYHATDLYVLDKPGVREWLKANYPYAGNMTSFTGIGAWAGKPALDIPFAGQWREEIQKPAPVTEALSDDEKKELAGLKAKSDPSDADKEKIKSLEAKKESAEKPAPKTEEHDTVTCLACGTEQAREVSLLGVLGNLEHHRCRACGMVFNRPAGA